MSVAQYLGVERPDTPLMVAACAAWKGWGAADPVLTVVNEFLELRKWGETAPFDERDIVHASLARLAHFDGPDDQTAAAALSWVLLPGADRLARSIAARAERTDTLVASNLWIAVKTANWRHPHRISAAIINETRRYCLAEVGIGRMAWRADRTWSRTDTDASLDVEDEDVVGEHADLTPDETLRRLASVAVATKILAQGEIEFLIDLAQAVEQHNGPATRGRYGLCTVAATTAVAVRLGITPRQVQRRARSILDRLQSVSMTELARDALSDEPVIGIGSGEEVGRFGLDVLAHLGGVA